MTRVKFVFRALNFFVHSRTSLLGGLSVGVNQDIIQLHTTFEKELVALSEVFIESSMNVDGLQSILSANWVWGVLRDNLQQIVIGAYQGEWATVVIDGFNWSYPAL